MSNQAGSQRGGRGGRGFRGDRGGHTGSAPINVPVNSSENLALPPGNPTKSNSSNLLGTVASANKAMTEWTQKRTDVEAERSRLTAQMLELGNEIKFASDDQSKKMIADPGYSATNAVAAMTDMLHQMQLLDARISTLGRELYYIDFIIGTPTHAARRSDESLVIREQAIAQREREIETLNDEIAARFDEIANREIELEELSRRLNGNPWVRDSDSE